MEPELFGWFLPVFWVLSQQEGWVVYYQVGIFSVGFCHPRSSPLGLIWLKGSVERVLVTLVCWIKPHLPAGTPSFPSSWNPSSHGTPPQAFSSARTPRFFLLKYPEQRQATVGLPTFPPCQVTFPYNQVFSSQVSSDYQGIPTCKLKSLPFLKHQFYWNGLESGDDLFW